MRNSRNFYTIVIVVLLIILLKDTHIFSIIVNVLDSIRVILIKVLTLLGELFK